MSGHLTEEDIARYHSRGLPPGERLRLSDHMHECDSCRSQIRAANPRLFDAAGFRADLLLPTEPQVSAQTDALPASASSTLRERLAAVFAPQTRFSLAAMGAACVMALIVGFFSGNTWNRDGKPQFPPQLIAKLEPDRAQIHAVPDATPNTKSIGQTHSDRGNSPRTNSTQKEKEAEKPRILPLSTHGFAQSAGSKVPSGQSSKNTQIAALPRRTTNKDKQTVKEDRQSEKNVTAAVQEALRNNPIRKLLPDEPAAHLPNYMPQGRVKRPRSPNEGTRRADPNTTEPPVNIEPPDTEPSNGMTQSSTGKAAVTLLSPVATYVSEQKPLLRWKPVREATLYKLELLDDINLPVGFPNEDVSAGKVSVTVAECSIKKDLERDTTYTWRVSAFDAEGKLLGVSVTARFGVLSEANLQQTQQMERRVRVGNLARNSADQALLLAAQYVRVGLYEPAETLLNDFLKLHPAHPQAKALYKNVLAARVQVK